MMRPRFLLGLIIVLAAVGTAVYRPGVLTLQTLTA
jgi:hypothetical protein